MQIDLLRTEANFGLTDVDKIDVINKYLIDNSPNSIVDVMETYSQQLPTVEDMTSLRQWVRAYVEGSYCDPLVSRWILGFLRAVTAPSLRFFIVTELGPLIPSFARAIGNTAFHSEEEYVDFTEYGQVANIYEQYVLSVPESLLFGRIMQSHIQKLAW